MALFSGFNQLSSAFDRLSSSNIGAQVNTLTTRASSAFNQFDSALSSARSGFQNQVRSSIPGLGAALDAANRVQSVAQEFQAVGNMFATGFGTRTRMGSNALQGVFGGAEPPSPNSATAVLVDNSTAPGGVDSTTNDWRVSLSVPDVIKTSPILAPFKNTSNKLIFPFNPTILFGNSANYSTVHPVHTNYPFYAYENSQVDAITVAGEYYSQNQEDAKYWIAVLHFLRTMTKMFYGGGENSGTPPLMTRLNGYGKHVLNNIPCVITTFSVDLPSDVDYIQVDINNEANYVPTRAQVNVTLQPLYSRLTQSRFDLRKFANGEFVTNDANNSGFI